MPIQVALLIASLAVILLGCDLFTNSIEWVGKKLRLSEGAVGSVLAAVGTCLPETLIAILAITFGRTSGDGDDVGIGAILGAPMMLSTLAFFVTGSAVLIYSKKHRRPMTMQVNPAVLIRDLRYFFIVFGISAAASLLEKPIYRYLVAMGLVSLYVLYVRQTFRDKSHSGGNEELNRLRLSPKMETPSLLFVIIQVIAGLAILVGGAHLFVNELTQVGRTTGIPLLVLSLIVTPIATELPEKFNSVLWVRQNKDALALGNISGAMVFQSSIPPAIGIAFTQWNLNEQAIASIIVAMVSSGVVWTDIMARKRLSAWSLLVGGFFYIVYLMCVLR